MSKISIDVGQRIRNYRIQQQLSQEELAERCGLHPTYIGQIERGEKNATLESICKIASGLAISLSVLFEKIDELEDNGNNYPSVAYDIIQTAPKENQEKLVDILKMIMEIK